MALVEKEKFIDDYLRMTRSILVKRLPIETTDEFILLLVATMEINSKVRHIVDEAKQKGLFQE